MKQKSRTYLMWGLYALLFLLFMMVQTTLFGRVRFFGTKLNLLPAVVVCVAMWSGHEAGGLFGLLAAWVWYASGGEDGIMAMISFTVMGILAGYLCSAVFPRRFVPAMGLCLCALLGHELTRFGLKFYLNGADFSLLRWSLTTVVITLPVCPVIYLLAKAVGKAGGRT